MSYDWHTPFTLTKGNFLTLQCAVFVWALLSKGWRSAPVIAVIRDNTNGRDKYDDIAATGGVREPVRQLLGHEAVADVEGGEHGERGNEAGLCNEPVHSQNS